MAQQLLPWIINLRMVKQEKILEIMAWSSYYMEKILKTWLQLGPQWKDPDKYGLLAVAIKIRS